MSWAFQVFHEVAYKAHNRDHLIAGLDEFLDLVSSTNVTRCIFPCIYIWGNMIKYTVEKSQANHLIAGLDEFLDLVISTIFYLPMPGQIFMTMRDRLGRSMNNIY